MPRHRASLQLWKRFSINQSAKFRSLVSSNSPRCNQKTIVERSSQQENFARFQLMSFRSVKRSGPFQFLTPKFSKVWYQPQIVLCCWRNFGCCYLFTFCNSFLIYRQCKRSSAYFPVRFEHKTFVLPLYIFFFIWQKSAKGNHKCKSKPRLKLDNMHIWILQEGRRIHVISNHDRKSQLSG